MKKKLNYLIGSFYLCVTLVTAGCSDEDKYAAGYSYYDDVELKINQVDEKNVLSVKLADETYPLSIAVTPETLPSNYANYVYEVSDNSVATVDYKGVLSLLKPGETTLTVRHRGNKRISTDCTLRVVASLIRDVVVSPEVVIGTEEPVDLAKYVTVMPWSADARALSYSVKPEYEGVVELLEGSIVQGLTIGEAIVEVRSTDGMDVAKELRLVVKGGTPIEQIKLNEEADKINGQNLLVGQEFDLTTCLTILPENAADKRMKYEVVSGTDCVSISEEGILTTTAGGEVTVQISPLDEELNTGVVPCMLTFTVKSWNERENWTVSTSITYTKGGLNYVPDKETGKPEDIFDDKFDTYLSLAKPGKSYDGYVADAIDVPLYFLVDMGMPQSFNYFTWGHRSSNTNSYLRVWGVTLFGSNDGVSFDEIATNVKIDYTKNDELMEFAIPKSIYRYIKVQYVDWSDLNGNALGSTIQVAEFNVGMK